MFKLATMICATALCVALPAFAAPDLETFRKQVDAAMDAKMREQHVPGVAVTVLHKGEIVIEKGYGFANIEHDVPVTKETIFQSGSVGKMFTAVAVMKLVEQGKIKLDDPVSKYLPNTPASWKPITVRHLLTHTSGISEFPEDFNLQKDYTDDELLQIFAKQPLTFTPGTRWSYSNPGYETLGFLIKKASGKSYLEILDSEVFKPLGMKTARGISEADIVKHRAAGYQVVKGELKNQDWVSPSLNTTADGALYFSIDDMVAWMRGVEQGKVLSAESWKQVYTPVKLASGKTYPYGFGWGVDTAGGKPRHHHGGAWQGFRTYVSHYLGDELSVVVLTNSAGAKPEEFNDLVAAAWDPALTAPPPRPQAEPEIEKRVAAMIETVRAGKLRPQDIPLAPSSFAKVINQAFGPALKELGPVTKLELTERKEMGDDTVYTYMASFGDQTRKITYDVAPGNRVAMFMVR